MSDKMKRMMMMRHGHGAFRPEMHFDSRRIADNDGNIYI